MPLINRFIMFLLASTTAHAAIIHTLDEQKVLEISVSQEGLTRIKVENDRILNVIGMAGEYALETDEHQGQVFIRPNHEVKPIHLTLTTEAGHTQDLRLIPKTQAPEALILKVDTELAQELDREKQAFAPLFREEVEELIHACRRERIPLGYREVPLDLSTLQGPHLLVREIQGQKLRGLTYRVQNDSQEVVVLSEPELAKELPKLIALFIPQKTLNPGEETDVYVVARAN
jgi:type-F conjugative transfer system secretin TraK